MIKKIMLSLILSNYLYSAEYLSNEIKDLLDIETNKSVSQIHNKMTYKEFIEYRWENNIEFSESWGTEIMYQFYLMENTKNLEKIIKLMESNSRRLTYTNMEEIENEILLKYDQKIIDENEMEILNKTVKEVTRVMLSEHLGGEGGSSGDGGDGDGDGGDGD